MTELAHVTDTQNVSATLAAKLDYAEQLAGSSLLPKAYARQPSNVLIALELGEALGIPAIQAISGIHIVEGKPSASSELIASLVRRAGHKLRITTSVEHSKVKAELIRKDDPDHTFVAVWDMKRAQQAGLTGKAVWKQYPIAMLTARAITEVARQGASDALYGVSRTPEEVEFSVPAARQLHQQRVTAADIAAQMDDPETEPVEAEIVDEQTGEVAHDWPSEDGAA